MWIHNSRAWPIRMRVRCVSCNARNSAFLKHLAEDRIAVSARNVTGSFLVQNVQYQSPAQCNTIATSTATDCTDSAERKDREDTHSSQPAKHFTSRPENSTRFHVQTVQSSLTSETCTDRRGREKPPVAFMIHRPYSLYVGLAKRKKNHLFALHYTYGECAIAKPPRLYTDSHRPCRMQQYLIFWNMLAVGFVSDRLFLPSVKQCSFCVV